MLTPFGWSRPKSSNRLNPHYVESEPLESTFCTTYAKCAVLSRSPHVWENSGSIAGLLTFMRRSCVDAAHPRLPLFHGALRMRCSATGVLLGKRTILCCVALGPGRPRRIFFIFSPLDPLAVPCDTNSQSAIPIRCSYYYYV